MFISKNPLLWMLQLLVVGAVVSFVVWKTGNALAVLALLLMWDSPPLALDKRSNDDDDEDEEEPAPRSIGFTA